MKKKKKVFMYHSRFLNNCTDIYTVMYDIIRYTWETILCLCLDKKKHYSSINVGKGYSAMLTLIKVTYLIFLMNSEK